MPDAATGRALAGACLMVCAFAAGAQAMYKWVDEKGVTHFSESPPPDGKKAAKIEPKVTPPSAAPPAARKDGADAWKQQETEFRRRQVERGQREQADAKGRADQQARCAEGRRRLAFLEEPGAIYQRKDDGAKAYMSDSAREAQINELRADIRRYCN